MQECWLREGFRSFRWVHGNFSFLYSSHFFLLFNFFSTSLYLSSLSRSILPWGLRYRNAKLRATLPLLTRSLVLTHRLLFISWRFFSSRFFCSSIPQREQLVHQNATRNYVEEFRGPIPLASSRADSWRDILLKESEQTWESAEAERRNLLPKFCRNRGTELSSKTVKRRHEDAESVESENFSSYPDEQLFFFRDTALNRPCGQLLLIFSSRFSGEEITFRSWNFLVDAIVAFHPHRLHLFAPVRNSCNCSVYKTLEIKRF